jgi:hypothetical protein
MNIEERLAHQRGMAEAYRDAYLHQGVQNGEAFADAWKFADDAVYVSPYFTGDQVFKFSEFPEDTARASTMEAKVYSLNFPDWKPADFKYWPAENGVVMKTPWKGHSNEYNAFLDVAIGVHGPFHGTGEYVEVLELCLKRAGVPVR